MAKGKKAKVAKLAGVDKYPKLEKLPVIEKCEGCERVEEVNNKKVCQKYVDPSFHWENDQICSFATHVKREVKVAKKVVNPLKASKRAARGK